VSGKPTRVEVKVASPKEVAARTAEELLNKRDYDGAVRALEKLYELTHDPAVLFKIGGVYQEKGDLASARTYLGRYLTEEKDEAGRARGKAALEAVLDRIPGRVVVSTDPKGAVVEIDGVKVGNAPLTKELKRGPHEVKVHLEGYEPASTIVPLTPGEEAKAALVLRPVKAAQAKPPATPRAPAPAPAKEAAQAGQPQVAQSQTAQVQTAQTQGAQVPPQSPATRPAVEAPQGPRPAAKETMVKPATRFGWHFVALGAGAALLVTGGVMTGLASRDRDKVSSAHTEEGVVAMSKAEAESLASSADTKDKASYVLYGLGAAAVVTGAVLWVLDARSSPSSIKTMPALAVTSDGMVFGACGRF